ncbi:MAG: hypothetical protein SFY32_13870 [Bacteroidota bacterium]|nr:hypothetical protein [Bacteroidota bacterium]
MDKQILLKKTLDNMERLPTFKIKEVNDYVEFLLHKIDDQLLNQGIQDIASSSKSFDFLNKEPDLYSINDLKLKFK